MECQKAYWYPTMNFELHILLMNGPAKTVAVLSSSIDRLKESKCRRCPIPCHSCLPTWTLQSYVIKYEALVSRLNYGRVDANQQRMNSLTIWNHPEALKGVFKKSAHPKNNPLRCNHLQTTIEPWHFMHLSFNSCGCCYLVECCLKRAKNIQGQKPSFAMLAQTS